MSDKKKILVADDELYIRLLVKDILEPEFDVIEASNGEEAVSTTRNELPALVFAFNHQLISYFKFSHVITNKLVLINCIF